MPDPHEMLHRRWPTQFDPAPPWIIHWDPIPPWLKLNDDQLRKFAAVEVRLNAKIQELQVQMTQEIAKIETQKMAEFEKILGGGR